MPSFCCIVGCGSNKLRDNISFHRIPSILSFVHKKHLNELSKIRRQKWLAAIKRADFTECKIKYALVCSRHFISGKPSTLIDDLNPDWVPSLNLGYKKNAPTVFRFKRSKFRENVKVSRSIPSIENTDTNEEISEVVDDLMKSSQTDIDLTELTDLFNKLSSNLNEINILKKRAMCSETLENDDVKTNYFTGLNNYKIFLTVQKFLTPYILGKSALSPAEQVLLTFMKLRLNLDFKDLAYRFGIHSATASNYFKNIIQIMSIRLKSLIIWPEKSVLLKTIPKCFKESFHSNTTVIIDCFEIKCETPSNLCVAAQVWSNYKHYQTIKYLIGITPQGYICFLNEGWGGRVSDKFLTQNSSFLSKLCPGDVILADRGFLIKEFVELFKATVKTPAFTKGKDQLHPIDLEETRSIAHVRIHVERIIGLLRNKYKILCGPVPMTLLSTRSETGEALLDEIVLTCCALINICPALVPL